MATWNEQLTRIQALRQRRNESDERLYRTQIGLQEINDVLRKAGNRETTDPTDLQGISELRERISKLKQSLLDINKQTTEIGSRLSAIKDMDAQLVFISKKIESLTAEILATSEQLAALRRESNGDRKKIKELEEKLDNLRQLLHSLNKDLEKLKRARAESGNQEQDDRRKKEQLDRTKKEILANISQLQDALAEKLNTDSFAPDEAVHEKEKLEQEYKAAKSALDASRVELNEAIIGIYQNPHPRSVVNKLNDKIPFLLMPVRIETRFITTGSSPELWVRIYPDDIAVHTHEKLLTKVELLDGREYWKSLFQAEKMDGAEGEDLKKQAWNELAGSFDAQRAAWIASQTKPLNWDQIDTLDNADQLVYPPQDMTKLSAWSRAPRAYELPDKFVVMLYEGDTIAKEVTGNIIPDELFLGPDPMEAEDAFITKNGLLEFGESFDWTSNFDKAVDVGMGVRIPLSAAQASAGFDRILVLGLMLSADAQQGQQNLEALIENHHYSSKGFSVVPQGTPTNNTEQGRSGYTTNDPFNNISYFVETGKPLFTDETDCDGRNLANALGINYAPLHYVQHSNATDRKEAVAMNRALYASTLGYYFSTMLAPVLTPATQAQLKEFFIPYVTGRGSLPAIRVGDQPYGVLLTSDYSKWKWSAAETGADNKFFTGLQDVMHRYSNYWNSFVHEVMYTGKPGVDPAKVMMDILGLQSGSVSFRRRVAYTTDDLKNRAALMETEEYNVDLNKNFFSKSNVIVFFTGLGYEMLDERGDVKVPQLLRLVYQHFSTALNAADLVDDRPLSESDPIHFYNKLAKKNYINWLIDTDTVEKLRQRDFGEGRIPPNSLLFLQLIRSLLLELHAGSTEWLQNQGIDFSSTMAVANFHNIRKPDITKWEVMKGKVGIAVPAHAFNDKAIGDYLITDGSGEAAAASLAKVKAALAELADLPTARLERCFTEHIDTCTYRLDAWQSAFFQRRLESQRRSASLGSSRGQGRGMGIYLGAFGWVEDVRPSVKRRVTGRGEVPGDPVADLSPLFEYADNGGFVHAPSLNQAIAAAVLRSGYMNHATSSQPGMMSVNLSSQRVRNAMFILEGIRNGQSLEALLGYQFERGLHDRGSLSDDMKLLNAYIYDFRQRYPLYRHVVLQQGATSTTETIPANDVVNGLVLAERTDEFPWGATGDVASASEDLKKAVIEERNKLLDTLDAVKDLLLSEGVYQLIQGNFDRAAAVTNAMKDSNIPPDIDITQTPRSSKFTFTNRVTIQFQKTVPADDAGPRGIMEPGLNKWLHTVLGNMQELAFNVSLADGSLPEDMTVEQLGLQPIDLIYVAGNELNTGSGTEGNQNSTAASELETRIARAYRRLKILDDDEPVTISFLQLENPAGKKPLGQLLPLLRKIKSMITNSRNLNAEDFVSSSKEIITDTTNRKGYNPEELKGRIEQVMILFNNYLARLNGADIFLSEPVGPLNGLVKLGDLLGAMSETNKSFSDVPFTFGNAEAANLLDTLTLISNFGIVDSFPLTGTAITNESKLILLTQAMNISRQMTAIQLGVGGFFSTASTSTDAERKTELFVQAAKLLFGEMFSVLPVFNYRNGADIQHSSDERAQLLKHATDQLKMNFVADEWLQNIAHVRPRLATWDTIRTLSEIFTGETLELKPVQLPYRANDSWIAVEFPAESQPGIPFTIDHDTLSITIHGDGGFAISEDQSGLMIDEIVEMIPGKDEITGVTFNYNQPNSLPPQALLLAVPPEEKGHWDWDELVGILNDTLQRAKQRAVEPDILNKSTRSEIGVLLPAILANFGETDLDLALDYTTNVDFYATNNPVNIAIA